MKTDRISEKNRLILSVGVNGVLFLCVAVTGTLGFFYGASGGQAGTDIIGVGYLKPFTMDSNILAGISALILVLYGVRSLIRKENTVPRWAVTLQFMAAVCLFLTFLTAAGTRWPRSS